MSEPREPRMTPLDQMISNDNLQLLKAAIPYAPPSMRSTLSVYAKFRELQSVLELSRRPPAVQMMSSGQARGMDVLQELGSYTSGQLHEMVQNLSSALETLQMFQMYQAMADSAAAEETSKTEPLDSLQETKGDLYE